MKKTQVIIMRGHQGSGKTTFACRFFDFLSKTETGVICSADSFFRNSKGQYKFVAEKLGDAHKKCYSDFRDVIGNWHLDWPNHTAHYIFVDNTNAEAYEIAPYITESLHNNAATISIVTLFGDYQNVHGVPDNAVQAKRSRIARNCLPGHWNGFLRCVSEPEQLYNILNGIQPKEIANES